MGRHDQHLPRRPLDKAANPADLPNIDYGTRKRFARGIALRKKDDAKRARQGDKN